MRPSAYIVTLLFSPLLHSETLTIFIWEDYLSQQVIESWETTTGHTVQQIYFDNDEERDIAIASNQIPDIDLVIVDQIASIKLGQNGVLLPKPTKKEMPGLLEIDPEWEQRCGMHGIPYLWGTLGVAYRTDKLKKPPTSWKELLEPTQELSGHIGLFEDYTDLLAPALFLLGHSINTEDKQELQSAFKMTKRTLRNVLTFEYPLSYLGANPKDDTLHITLAYSGDQYSLNDYAGKEIWDYTTLQEGTVIWVDCLSMPTQSPNKDLALSFLNHLYSLENAAQNSEDLYVATPISAAKTMQSKELQEDITVYPPKALIERSQFYTELSTSNINLRNRITSSLVKLHDSK